MSKSIPVLNWTRHDVSCYWQADITPEMSYRIFEVSGNGRLIDRVGYELWFGDLTDFRHDFLGWHPTLTEAQAAARTHVGDDEKKDA